MALASAVQSTRGAPERELSSGASCSPADPFRPQIERERAGHAAEHEPAGGERPDDCHRAAREERRVVRHRAIPTNVQEVLQDLHKQRRVLHAPVGAAPNEIITMHAR